MRPALVAAAASAALVALGWAVFRNALPERIDGVLPGDVPAPYIHLFPKTPAALGTVLLVHGLDSNKDLMQLLAMAMADGGFETWSIDLPGHGDSTLPFSSDAGERTIDAALDALGNETIVVGHSLGSALVADLATSRRLGTVVLLSPPPIPLAPLRIDRLLVMSGRFDAPRINEAIPALLEYAGPDAEWREFRWGAHSTALYNPSQQREIVAWIGGAPESIRTGRRLGAMILMLLGAVVVPGFALWRHQRTRRGEEEAGPAPETQTPETRPATDITARVGALGASLFLLHLFNPLGWLHLFRTDYLLGVLFISGVILWLWRGRGSPVTARGLAVGAGAGAYLILAMWVIASPVAHLVPSGEQWLRVPVIAALCFPIGLYDEQVLRAYRSGWVRWGMLLLGRGLIWAAVMTGVLLFNPEAAFLILITHLVLLGWTGLWWPASIVRRATGEPAAAALFSSLVLGWVFAALFVTI